MKATTAQVLSAHLLREAARFLLYPERQHRTQTNVRAQRMVDEALRRLVELRTTFSPTAVGKLNFKPELLDELYCRELLRAVPQMVERTLSLAARTIDGIPDDESFFYLKEAVKCYLHGLPEASVALARAAVEAGLRKRASKAVGKEAVAAADLKRVIDEYSSKARLLSREGRARAHRVRVAANDILHQRSRGTPDALRAVEDAREVILELGH